MIPEISLLLGALLLLLAPLCLLLLHLAFNPAAVKRRKLAKQARIDYRDARGTAHLRLLRQGRARMSRARQHYIQQRVAVEKQIAALEKERSNQVMATLERCIAYSHLDEVQGIGPALKERILSTVYRRHLTDLYAANQVRGVGDVRYWRIRHWVASYLPRLPSLVETDFPGKQEVLAGYDEQKCVKQAMLRNLTTQISELDERLARLQLEIAWLEKVKPEHFVRALTGQGPVPAELNDYLRGAFAEWEPMPDWFREALGEAGDVRVG